MRLKNLVLVLLCVLMSQVQAKFEGDEWAGTKVDFTLVEHFTRKVYPCGKSAINHLSCVYLVNGMASNLKPAQLLMPKGSEALYAGVKYTVMKDLGPLQLIRIDTLSPEKLTPLADSKLTRARVNALTAAAAVSFKTQPKFDFAGLTKELLPQIAPDISTQAALALSVNRMISVQDAHGHLNSVKADDENAANADVRLVGIGVEIHVDQEGAKVGEVVEGGPGSKFGVREGDVIKLVDNFSTPGATSQAVVDKIRGTAGSTVVLKIDRKGQSVELTLVRGPVEWPNVETKIVEDMGIKIARIRLKTFIDRKACTKIEAILNSLPLDVQGIVLDLRGDPGGFMDQAVCIGGLFIGKHPITLVKEVHNGVTSDWSNPLVSEKGMATALPLVVLTNNGSASASEIVAGAIQDYQRGWILGTTTFGKGSVQGPDDDFTMFDKQVRWFKTVARFYQPLDHTNQLVGIQPDFEVFSKPNPTEEEKFLPREADVTPTALSAYGKPWVQTRGPEISALKNGCLSAKRAESVFESRSGDNKAPDFQLLSAQELLSCMVSE